MKRSTMKASSFALPKQRKYPITDASHARNAIARVSQFGSTREKAAVFAKVRQRFPGIAKRSTVVPTSSGPGRHFGQKKGTTNRKR